MSPLYITDSGTKFVPLLPNSAYRSSDVLVYIVTELGRAKVSNGVPVCELEAGVDLKLVDVIPFRPTPTDSFRSAGSYKSALDIAASYRKSVELK